MKRFQRARHWIHEWEDVVLWWLALGCAGLLLLAIAMPDWFARTSWSRGNENRSTTLFDSPAGYVGLVSLCGIVAFVALTAGMWRERSALASAVAATAAFAVAAGVAGNHWLALMRGEALVDGHWEMGSRWTVQWPTALPLIGLASVIGTVSALALVVYLHRRRMGNF